MTDRLQGLDLDQAIGGIGNVDTENLNRAATGLRRRADGRLWPWHDKRPTNVAKLRPGGQHHSREARVAGTRAGSATSSDARTLTRPINSNALRHHGSVRRVTSCSATTSGSRRASAVACSTIRDARRATFQVINRRQRSSE